MSCAQRRIGHDSGFVLKRIADIAVGVEHAARVSDVLVPSVAVILERDAFIQQCVANAAHRCWRDSERRGCETDRVSVGVVAGIVVVEQVIVTSLAIGIDRR